MFLKIPSVRKYFNIEQKRKVEEKGKKKKKGMIGGFKECKYYLNIIHV